MLVDLYISPQFLPPGNKIIISKSDSYFQRKPSLVALLEPLKIKQSGVEKPMRN
jgi:hypothetical protein